MEIENPFSAGYVLITAGTNDVHALRTELLAIEGVRLVHALIGPDDLICFVDAADATNFRRILDRGIRKLMDQGLIEHTETMIVLADSGHGYSGDENRPAPAAAWLLCDLAVGDPEPVAKKLLEVEGVRNAHPVLGRYDIVVYLEAVSIAELMRVLDEGIRHITEVRKTDTRLVLMNIGDGIPERNRQDQKIIGTRRRAI
jgi:DNA-binding Lrp family transcriptional regulator